MCIHSAFSLTDKAVRNVTPVEHYEKHAVDSCSEYKKQCRGIAEVIETKSFEMTAEESAGQSIAKKKKNAGISIVFFFNMPVPCCE